jgi:outer membrane biogenesis lipoprotein LolB
MTRFILATLFLTACASDAKAPPVKEPAYIVRVAYLTDVKVEAYKSEKRCGVTRDFIAKELPQMDGYTLVVRCVAIGEK